MLATTVPPDLRDTLIALERELHRPEHSPGRFEQLLDAEFCEHGRSGRAWDRPAILRMLAEAEPVDIHAQDFVLQPLGDDLVLLRYRSAHRAPGGALERHSLRASLWRHDARLGWRLVFHQGTATAPFDATTG
ncbi:DUF4440 domain-containing protein [Pelomonas sp. CA6]|uniref:nuclear transport factor 2 family protein n=1 Tax=Pelomonas sp. CA6 TaxID=2907999 RepID=UPI001F4BF98E|nr:DUF4440 domain-containing protein [Pelomonas sp. CA6]MCH7345150.1 DUF4440 domain-containing protein [Pelomonas sp. CA6]